MGWFWGSDDQNGNKSQDPLRDLDPSLREFLAKESPVKYSSSNPPSTSPAPATPQPSQFAQAADNRTSNSAPRSDALKENKVPSASLFQDGRYADIWKTYQSQAETEAAGKSDQEKINDVLEGYKYRKAEIGRAALENCALEQWDGGEQKIREMLSHAIEVSQSPRLPINTRPTGGSRRANSNARRLFIPSNAGSRNGD